MKPKKVSRWLLFCEPCSYRRILQDDIKPVDLVEIPLVPIPSGAPKMDAATKKVKTPEALKRNKKYKCPQCGRGIMAKELPAAYLKAIEKAEKIELQELEKERRRIQEERAAKEKELIGEKDESKDHVARHQKRPVGRAVQEDTSGSSE